MSDSQASFPLYNGDINQLEKRLWESADQLRANSNLSASEYSNPVLGLIFLRYADHKFTVAQQELEGQSTGRKRRGIGKADFQAKGVMYLSEEARFSNLGSGQRMTRQISSMSAHGVSLGNLSPNTRRRVIPSW